MPSFNEVEEIPGEIDPVDHPLRLHRLSINRREDSSIFTAGWCFLPAHNQVTVHQHLHRPVVVPLLLEAAVEGLEQDLLEEDMMEEDIMEDVI